MDFKPLILTLFLIGIIAFAIIYTGIMIATDNEAEQSLRKDEKIASFIDALEKNLSQSYIDANASETALSGSEINILQGSVILNAISNIWKTLVIIPKAIFNLVIGLVKDKIFGNESYSIIFGVFTAMIIIILILSVWKLVYTGNS